MVKNIDRLGTDDYDGRTQIGFRFAAPFHSLLQANDGRVILFL